MDYYLFNRPQREGSWVGHVAEPILVLFSVAATWNHFLNRESCGSAQITNRKLHSNHENSSVYYLRQWGNCSICIGPNRPFCASVRLRVSVEYVSYEKVFLIKLSGWVGRRRKNNWSNLGSDPDSFMNQSCSRIISQDSSALGYDAW